MCSTKYLLRRTMTMFTLKCILLAVFLTAVLGENTPTSDCGRNIRNQSISYLNMAIDMILEAKSTYQCCSATNNSVKAIDCEESLKLGRNKSGVHVIWPKNRLLDGRQFEVYCDMVTDGGGWTVIQRRGNYSRPVDYFYKDWASYKAGFGDIQKDFWLGNNNIFALTNQRLYSVRFDLKAVDGSTAYALYDTFWIDDETHQYTLHIQDYSGNAGDSMITNHNNMKFSTKDVDNDMNKDGSCAQMYKGGWWYNVCHDSNLNGLYLSGHHKSYADGVNWHSWKGYHESLEITEIKIRPKNFRKEIYS